MNLVDVDASALVLLGLWNTDAQDTIAQVGGDTVSLDKSREVEAPRELADAAFRDPVLAVVSWLRNLLWLGDLGNSCNSCRWSRLFCARGACCLVNFIFNSGLVDSVLGWSGRFLFRCIGESSAHLAVVFEETSWWCSSGIRALNAATDEQSVRVGELDMHVFLVHAGELTVQLVGVLYFSNIKLWLEGWNMVSVTTLAILLAGIAVKVVEEAE